MVLFHDRRGGRFYFNVQKTISLMKQMRVNPWIFNKYNQKVFDNISKSIYILLTETIIYIESTFPMHIWLEKITGKEK